MANIFKQLFKQRDFKSLDFTTLKTALMIAALDGDVSSEELENFKNQASNCSGCTPESFAKLWDSALRSAGYLLIQSKLLPKDDLVNVFISEAERDFVTTATNECEVACERAFTFFASMANADGEFSDIEQKAIAALQDRISSRRTRMNSMVSSRSLRGSL